MKCHTEEKMESAAGKARGHAHGAAEGKPAFAKAAVWIAAILLVVALFQTFQIIGWKSSLKASLGGGSQGGETTEEMIARMHPDQAQAQVPQSARRPTQRDVMVGGC